MRIALGAEALSPQLTGIGRYTWELASRLPQIAEVENVKLFRDNAWHDNAEHFVRPNSRPAPRRILPRKLHAWFHKREFSQRLYHGPNFFFPVQAENAVVTVHDLSVFRFPETHPAERIRQFEKEFSRSIDHARHIITDTLFIKDELIEMFGVSPQRVTAIPLGVSEEFFNLSDEHSDRALIAEYGLSNTRYCLCVATIEPRKGLDHAVRAFLKYRDSAKSDAILVIVGATGWKNSDLHKLFEDAAATGAVKFLGFVSDPALRAIYRCCSLFLYPSLYEGFGLPVLEAMASRIPVLVSNRSCLPEVSGGVAMSVNVEDYGTFQDAISKGMEDEAWRKQVIASGLTLAKRLNWQECVKKTAALYGEIN